MGPIAIDGARLWRCPALLPVLLGALALSGCAVATPAALTHASPASGQVQAIALLAEQQDSGAQGALRDRLRAAIARALSERGLVLDEGGAQIADYAVSVRDAGLGVEGAAPGAQAPEGARQHWYHRCRASKVSASLILYARATGAVSARSDGHFLACPGDLSQLDDLARLLVDGAIGN